MTDEKTSAEKLASGQLEGLILPAPAEVSFGWLWLVAGFFIILLVFIWLKKRHSPKAKALRELQFLQSQITSETQAKQMASSIAVSLRQGLKLTRLDEFMPDNIRWRNYLNALDSAIYADTQPSQVELLSLILKARTWLNKFDV